MGRSANLAELVRARIAGFKHFADWEAAHPAVMSPADALASIGALYELLPPASRQRPIDPSGVRRMHEVLRRLPR